MKSVLQKASLPQFITEEDKAKRKMELSISKTDYNYMFSYLEPIPIAASVPKSEEFSPDYEYKVLQVFTPLVENFKAVIIGLIEKELLDDLPNDMRASFKAVEDAHDKLTAATDEGAIKKFVHEAEYVNELIHALAKIPKELEAAIQGAVRLPKDLIKMVEGLDKVFKEFEKEGSTAFLKNTMYDMLATDNNRDYLAATSTQDYVDLFKTLPVPDLLNIEKQSWMPQASEQEIWQQDWYFGYMQIAGFNTTNLKGVQLSNSHSSEVIVLVDLLKKMPITDAIFQQVSGNCDLTLHQAAEQGLLYVCDYAMMEGLEGSELHKKQRYPNAPIALFLWNKIPPKGYPSTGAMQPICIQLSQKFDPEAAPIYTPNDCTHNLDTHGYKWQIAKAFVQNACAIQHETVAHLGACHLTIEPMIVAANRQLAKAHPLMVLLKPHFKFTLPINDAAIHSLIVPGGVVASVLSTSHDSSAKMIVDAHNKWRFDDQFPDRLFKLRGVCEQSLPNFPFREDTLDLWQAIQEFVGQYLSLYYKGDSLLARDEQVAEDYELQNWINEMVDSRCAAIKGMEGLIETDSQGQAYQIRDFDYLIKLVSLIIYTASAQHASVNYAQWPLMSYMPSVSGTLYAQAPTRSDELTDKHYLACLPPLDVALYQATFGYLLSNVQYDRLGHYSDDPRKSYFQDPQVSAVVTEFQMKLNQIELDIHQRNKSRPFPYPFQLPSQVPNSISI